MITPDNLAPVLAACTTLAWPLFAIMLVFVFRNDIRQLLKRLQTAKLPGGTEAIFEYGEASVDKSAQPAPSKSAPAQILANEKPLSDQIRWNNTGNLYWLGHDLMWTIDVTLRNAPRETIVYGLRQSLHHAQCLGFTGTPLESRLARLKSDADRSLQQDWTTEKRTLLVNELASLRDEIGSLASSHQPDFRPNPVG